MTSITREMKWWPPGAAETRTIRATVTLPEPHPTLGYQCTLTLEGFDAPDMNARPGTFADPEAMVALTSALNMVPHVIEYHVRRAGGGRLEPPLDRDEDLHLLEAVRTLEYFAPGATEPSPVTVTIRPPYQEEDESWSCVLEIAGLGELEERTAHHRDGLGALYEALLLVPIVLEELTPSCGRWTCRGSDDLGFPVRQG